MWPAVPTTARRVAVLEAGGLGCMEPRLYAMRIDAGPRDTTARGRKPRRLSAGRRLLRGEFGLSRRRGAAQGGLPGGTHHGADDIAVGRRGALDIEQGAHAVIVGSA